MQRWRKSLSSLKSGLHVLTGEKMIEIEDIKDLHKQSGLSYRYVYRTLGINKSWYTKMTEYKFINPDPARMMFIRDYLHAIINVNNKFKKG